ncbi:FAD-dependent monooxygenase [Rhodobacteraceae bacterium NNCM2]|nr:FAD-dependent monooxygenase [Coraliihabitans acroporae]
MEHQAGTALVIGAGIGGTGCALGLARAGWKVRLVERAPEVSEVGAGIQVSPNGVKALEALGLADKVKAAAVMPQAAVMRDGLSGFEILRLPLGAAAEERWGAPYLHLHRADLLDILLRGAVEAGVELRTGHEATGFTLPPSNGATFADGTTEEADLVVVASGVRGGLVEENPEFGGQVAWRALVEAEKLPPGLIPREATVWAGPRRHLVTYQLRGGSLINIIAVQERRAWVAEGWAQRGKEFDLRVAFKGWHEDITQLLEAVDECYLWGLFERQVPEALNNGSRVTIGDAAHPMLPFMAQGATMALEDVVVLCRCLESRPVPEALAAFSSIRRPRVVKVQETSRENAKLFHRAGGVERMLVQGPIAIASRVMPAVAAGRLDWLYGHDVRND